MKILIIFLASLVLSLAQEMTTTLKKLRDKYDKLEGYQARYQCMTQNGKKGFLEIGADFESGWSSIKAELKDETGKILMKAQQWSTDEGNYVIGQGEKAIVFEGLGNLAKRFNGLQKMLHPEKAITLLRIIPDAHLTATNVNLGVGFASKGPSWLNEPERFIASNEKEIQLDWGKKSEVTVDLDSGLITKQVIKIDDVKRTMTLVDLKINPGKAAISKQFELKLEGAPRKDLADSGKSREFIKQVFQQVINEASQKKKVSKS